MIQEEILFNLQYRHCPMNRVPENQRAFRASPQTPLICEMLYSRPNWGVPWCVETQGHVRKYMCYVLRHDIPVMHVLQTSEVALVDETRGSPVPPASGEP